MTNQQPPTTHDTQRSGEFASVRPKTREEAHTCHAAACEAHVPPRMHMCRRHWFMVPKALRDGLWAAYRPGQERRMNPSPAYLLAAARCVHAVATKEGQPPEVIEGEVELYEAWHNMVADEPIDFMVHIGRIAAEPSRARPTSQE